MFKNYLGAIDNVSIYPIISLLIFVIFFVSLIFFVFKADKKYINHMESMPIKDNDIKIKI